MIFPEMMAIGRAGLLTYCFFAGASEVAAAGAFAALTGYN